MSNTQKKIDKFSNLRPWSIYQIDWKTVRACCNKFDWHMMDEKTLQNKLLLLWKMIYLLTAFFPYLAWVYETAGLPMERTIEQWAIPSQVYQRSQPRIVRKHSSQTCWYVCMAVAWYFFLSLPFFCYCWPFVWPISTKF